MLNLPGPLRSVRRLRRVRRVSFNQHCLGFVSTLAIKLGVVNGRLGGRVGVWLVVRYSLRVADQSPTDN